MKSKKQTSKLFLDRRSVARLGADPLQGIKGGTGKTDRTVADPITDLSWIKIKGCATHTSCGLYVCNGTGPIGK